MIREHDSVVLTAPLREEGLEPGDIGAVAHVYPRHEAYEIEFVTLTGKTAAVVTVPAALVRPVGSSEIPHSGRFVVSSRYFVPNQTLQATPVSAPVAFLRGVRFAGFAEVF